MLYYILIAIILFLFHMKYFNSRGKEITDRLEMGKVSYFPGANDKSLKQAKIFSKRIKNRVITVYNVYGIAVGYCVEN